jgi:membrane protease subunit (stomatin/prohibitin family)
MIDTRGGMTALANMDEFIKFKAAMALESAAENPNGTAATGVGMGAGLGMGFMLPQFLQQALKSGEGGTDTVKESPMDKIKKLKELLEMGAIIKEEFETKKKKLMEEI